MKLGQGNVFTGICDSVYRGVAASVHAGIPSPGVDTPQSRHLPGADTPCAEHAGKYGQHAGGTHPTGMQSCYLEIL